MLTISENWRRAYPGAHVGVLVMEDVVNPETCPELEREKNALEDELRTLFKVPADLKSMEPIRSYQNYYKRFNKTYHVLQQVQSVALKGKSIPKVAGLVEAMFMAELRNMLLTAGHDLDVVELPIRLDAAQGGEKFVRMNGEEQTLKQGDMYIADAQGIISSVVYGPDRRTRIRPSTTKVLFTVYSVPGVGEQATLQHLGGIESYVKLVAPDATTRLLQVYGAR
jgi:DNA/RNA-binding domain of Phe-tRNA-synthetase-like protein